METPEGITIPEKYHGELRVWFVRGAGSATRGAISPQDATEANLVGKDAYEAWSAGVKAGKRASSTEATTEQREGQEGPTASKDVVTITADDYKTLQSRMQELEEEVSAEKVARLQAEKDLVAAKTEIEELKGQLEKEQSKGFTDRLLGR